MHEVTNLDKFKPIVTSSDQFEYAKEEQIKLGRNPRSDRYL
jgi:hypothetical protein